MQEIDLTDLGKAGQISSEHIRFFIRMLRKDRLLQRLLVAQTVLPRLYVQTAGSPLEGDH